MKNNLIMKTGLMLLLFAINLNSLVAQNFSIRSTGGSITPLTNGPVAVNYPLPLNSIDISVTGGNQFPYNLRSSGAALGSIAANGTWVTINSPAGGSLLGNQIDIVNALGAAVLSFTLTGAAPGTSSFPNTSATAYLATLFPNIVTTEFGFQIPTTPPTLPNEAVGDGVTHIFFDQFGNSLLGAIPQGISNRQYVVHIIYLTNQNQPSQITYSLRQTKGNFNPSLVFNNAGQLSAFNFQNSGMAQPAISYAWVHQEFQLRTSTDDIEIEIYRNITTQSSPFEIKSDLIAKHTINMTKIFHGSFDFGLLRTSLENPDYSLVDLPGSTSNEKTVKEGKSGPTGIATVMATYYFSPVYLIRRAINKNLPKYKVNGRNFLDDHGLFERIYPAVGVALNDKAFENIFLGLNWEIARGGSFFIGWHFGRVNVFKGPANFEFGTTTITQQGFELAKDQAWRTEIAFGVNLDVLVITNLFRTNTGTK